MITGSTTPTTIGYHQQDGLGNVIGVHNGSSASQHILYTTWGTPTFQSSTTNRLAWKGLLYEGDGVNLYYMRARWYDPETGRFISEDPIGLAGGINQYAFAGNDPVNGWDPSGLCVIVPTTFNSRGAIGVAARCPGSGDRYFGVRSVWRNLISGASGWESGQWEPDGNGLTAAESASVVEEVGRLLAPVDTGFQCAAAVAVAGSTLASYTRVAGSGARAAAHGWLAASSAREASRLWVRNIVPKPGGAMAALAADATAVYHRNLRLSYSRAALNAAATGGLGAGASQLIDPVTNFLLGDFQRVANTCN
jgi:RHS repeat-associated protein